MAKKSPARASKSQGGSATAEARARETGGNAPKKPAYRRVLLKLSGEALLGAKTFGIDRAFADYLAEEIRSPTVERRGFLPIATTRGDRLFIGLLSAAYVNLLFVAVSEKLMEWMKLDEEPSIWISFALSMALLALIMRKG